MSVVNLHFTEQGAGAPLIILHGLFGSADNWRTLSRRLADSYRVIAVDLRNHGRSPHTDGMAYQSMADDVLALMDRLDLSQVYLLGHSMGGKVAMQLALQYPERVKALIVVDIAPVVYDHGHDDVLAALYAVKNVDGVASRKEADGIMAQHLETADIRQFLMTNLQKQEDGRLNWRVGLDQIYKDYDAVVQAPCGSTFYGSALFLRGGQSHYVEDRYLPQIGDLFPDYQLVTMPECGHWLHAEQPAIFLQHVDQFLKKQEQAE